LSSGQPVPRQIYPANRGYHRRAPAPLGPKGRRFHRAEPVQPVEL